MKGYWDQLRPLEKRMAVGILAVLFVVLNLWFVVPHFSDWGKVQGDAGKARSTLELYQSKIRQSAGYEREIKKFESEGPSVPPEDQSTHFATTIQSQATQVGAEIQNDSRTTATSNQFFMELSKTISVLSKEQPLVDFLYNLGSGNSLIRVRDLTLRPDQAHQKLSSNIKLVASYQKKAPSKTAVPAAVTPPTLPAARPSPQATNRPPARIVGPPTNSIKPGASGPKTATPTKKP